MGFFKKRRRKPEIKLKHRLLRTIISVVVLTAFVLSLSLFIKQLSTTDPKKIVAIAAPFLTKIGISDEEAGEVAGAFVRRIFKTNIEPAKSYPKGNNSQITVLNTVEPVPTDNKIDSADTLLFKIAILSDSHSNILNLQNALEIAKTYNIHSLYFLGDYTDLGEEEKLKESKNIMDSSGIMYYSLPGDRDLYKTVGRGNFDKIFGQAPLSVVINGVKLILLDNSANYTLIGDDMIKNFKGELADADFVLMSQPVYYPNVSVAKPVMGYVMGEETYEIKKQAEEVLTFVRDSNVKAIVAGDHHSFSRYTDAQKSTLEHITVGSVTDELAELGRPSMLILGVYSSGGYTVEDINF